MQLTRQFPADPPQKVWNSGDIMVLIYHVPSVDPLHWNVNDHVNANKTPEEFTSLKVTQELSEFEKSMMELVTEGLATEEYVQDVFKQEQIFKDNFERSTREHPNEAIVVCGDEIFVGDSLDDLESKAQKKYPDRPPYSYSPTIES